MESSLRDESDYFHYATRSQDRRVAQRTQSTFTSYAREECLALTNPYQSGTIVPILYGECVLGFDHQRLDYLRHAITSFKKGGESQKAS
jgi:hypothetical protein